MKLQFNYIEIEHFKSFIKPAALNLADLSGLNFLRGKNATEPRLGSNGAGKSSLFDALCWCLYGRTPDGLRNPDIKPWIGKGTPSVTVELAIDGKKHVIKRVAKTNGLMIDHQEASQEKLTSLLRMDVGVFCHTILLGQSQPLFFDLQPKQKMDLFAEVLELERWDSRAQLASAKASARTQKLSYLDGELTGLESSQERVRALIKSTKAQFEEWEATHLDRLQGYREDLEHTQRRIGPLQNEIDKAELRQDEAGIQVKLMNLDLDKLDEEIRNYEVQLIERSNRIAQIKNEMDDLKDELANKSDTCPTCGQSLKGTSLAYHTKLLQEEVSKLEKQLKGIDRTTLDKAIREARKRRLELSTSHADFAASEQNARMAIISHSKTMAELKANASSLARDIAMMEGQANPHRANLQDLRRQSKKLEVEVRDMRERMEKLQKLVERTRFWIRGFRDVRLYVIEDVLTELQMTTNSMLDEVGLFGWAVEFSIEKETKTGTIQRGLTTTILSPHNKSPVRWESWSGGEGQRLRLIGALALSEVLLNYAGVEVNLEILDEPTQHLSQEGISDLCDFLSERAKALDRTIFYVDHNVVESAKFNSVITVTKDKQGSTIKA